MAQADLGLLLLTEEAQNMEDAYKAKAREEEKRREKAGFWGGIGGGLGGLLGGLAMNAILPGSGFLASALGKSLAIGAGSGLGSLAGSTVGTHASGGTRKDATDLENYESVLGGRREFTESRKDLWNQDIDDYQDFANSQILSQAGGTAIKAAMLAGLGDVVGQHLKARVPKADQSAIDARIAKSRLDMADKTNKALFQKGSLGGEVRSRLPLPDMPNTPMYIGDPIPGVTAPAPALTTSQNIADKLGGGDLTLSHQIQQGPPLNVTSGSPFAGKAASLPDGTVIPNLLGKLSVDNTLWQRANPYMSTLPHIRKNPADGTFVVPIDAGGSGYTNFTPGGRAIQFN